MFKQAFKGSIPQETNVGWVEVPGANSASSLSALPNISKFRPPSLVKAPSP